MPPADSREDLIKQIAFEIGFSAVGIASITPCRESERIFDDWLRGRKHADMQYLARWREKRKNPQLFLPGAKSAVCVGLNYYSPSAAVNENDALAGGRGVFSIYAHGRDYHTVLGGMLSILAKRLRELFPSIETTACVDTRPVSDRTLALLSGIAWLGKNTNVISPEFGSWIFLGSLLTDLELAADAPLGSLCGDCTLCIDSCPAGAIEEGFIIDARKCISYQTVEKRGEIPLEEHRAIGMNVFGCDKCQLVCPFNSTAKRSALFRGGGVNPLIDMPLADLVNIGDALFDECTRDSVIRRCGADGIRRNARIVLGNRRRESSG